jgi:hypothetical protein
MHSRFSDRAHVPVTRWLSDAQLHRAHVECGIVNIVMIHFAP